MRKSIGSFFRVNINILQKQHQKSYNITDKITVIEAIIIGLIIYKQPPTIESSIRPINKIW